MKSGSRKRRATFSRAGAQRGLEQGELTLETSADHAHPHQSGAALIIVVRPSTHRGDRYGAWLGTGERLVVASRQPFLDSARVLLAWGRSPDTIIEMRRQGSAVPSLRSTVGAAAKLTVDETSRTTFARWKPFPSKVQGRQREKRAFGSTEVASHNRSNERSPRRGATTATSSSGREGD
jgi:hypothetical protein